MNEQTRQKIIDWIFENHHHHDYEDIPRKGEPGTFDEKYTDCPESNYPYVNSMALEKFIKEL